MYKNCPFITGITGFSILAFGIVGSWYLFPYILDKQIHANIDLVPGTQAYSFWEKQPFPLKFKITFFNVTNPDEVQQGANPIVREVGPFVYDEYRVREQIQVNEEKDVLKYVLKKHFYFNKTDSGCHDQDDYVTILNAALVGTALQVEILLPSVLPTISDAIPYLYPGIKNVFLTARVRDILFDGIRLYCQDEEAQTVCLAMQGALPKTMRMAENGKDFIFSMFGHLNGSDDGPWEMGRGLKNTTRGDVYSYEDENILDIWGDQYCNSINGSDSTVFPIFKGGQRPERLYTFVQDFCRSLYASYEKETTQFGLAAIRYTSKPESLAQSPENRCFCPIMTDDNGDDIVQCPPNGLADITPCFKAPVLISYPHFYLADPKLLDYVTGLDPKKELHENFAILEPITATPLSGRKRVQINIHLKKFEDFEIMQNVSTGIFPILWIEEGVTLPDDIANFLVKNLSKIGMLTVLKWVLIVIGLLIMLTGLLMVMRREKVLCFGDTATVNITTDKHRVDDDNRGHEMNHGLYPQLDNKNASDNFSLRNPASQQPWNMHAWQN